MFTFWNKGSIISILSIINKYIFARRLIRFNTNCKPLICTAHFTTRQLKNIRPLLKPLYNNMLRTIIVSQNFKSFTTPNALDKWKCAIVSQNFKSFTTPNALDKWKCAIVSQNFKSFTTPNALDEWKCAPNFVWGIDRSLLSYSRRPSAGSGGLIAMHFKCFAELRPRKKIWRAKYLLEKSHNTSSTHLKKVTLQVLTWKKSQHFKYSLEKSHNTSSTHLKKVSTLQRQIQVERMNSELVLLCFGGHQFSQFVVICSFCVVLMKFIW